MHLETGSLKTAPTAINLPGTFFEAADLLHRGAQPK